MTSPRSPLVYSVPLRLTLTTTEYSLSKPTPPQRFVRTTKSLFVQPTLLSQQARHLSSPARPLLYNHAPIILKGLFSSPISISTPLLYRCLLSITAVPCAIPSPHSCLNEIILRNGNKINFYHTPLYSTNTLLLRSYSAPYPRSTPTPTHLRLAHQVL